MADNNERMIIDVVVRHRGGTSEALSRVNPLPEKREIMVETDTCKFKFGDGVHRWNELEYANIQSTPDFLSVIVTSQNISEKEIELPENCEYVINVAIQGILTEPDVDWEIIEQAEKKYISWKGLELENIVRENDKIFIKYYRR